MFVAALKGLFSSGVVGSVERIASEYIQTDKETAEAKSLMVKVLDPNGLMRRRISNTVCTLYSLYICVMLLLIVMQFFGVGIEVLEDGTVVSNQVDLAVTSIKGLFADITQAFIVIIGASFGVNGVNSFKQN